MAPSIMLVDHRNGVMAFLSNQPECFAISGNEEQAIAALVASHPMPFTHSNQAMKTQWIGRVVEPEVPSPEVIERVVYYSEDGEKPNPKHLIHAEIYSKKYEIEWRQSDADQVMQICQEHRIKLSDIRYYQPGDRLTRPFGLVPTSSAMVTTKAFDKLRELKVVSLHAFLD